MGFLSESGKDSDSGEDDQLLYQPTAGSVLTPLPTFIGFRQDCLAEKQSVLWFEQHIWRSKEVSLRPA